MTLLRRLWSLDLTPYCCAAMCAFAVGLPPHINRPRWAVYYAVISFGFIALSSVRNQGGVSRAAWLLSGLAYLVASVFLLARVGP